MTAEILQLSDLHLFCEAGTLLRGVPTGQSLEQVLELIEERAARCERIVLTGDLAHDELPATYLQLRERLTAGNLLEKCLLLPGNHDSRTGMRAAFPRQTDRCELLPAPRCDSLSRDEQPVLFAVAAGGWHLWGLDSHIPGEVCGRVSDPVTDWLEEGLQQHPEVPAAIFLHHPPVVTGSPWLDRLGLLEPERLLAVLQAAPQVRLVCCGHIHQDWGTVRGTTRILSAPSTCVQFSGSSSTPEYEHLPPGVRLLDLGPEDFSTRTLRLPELRFPPDPA
ncbi:MAG: phosphodiesterase [Planctomycetaceae bacterium]|nr:phosphodiesterase [Planctomycetaceae bacterium]